MATSAQLCEIVHLHITALGVLVWCLSLTITAWHQVSVTELDHSVVRYGMYGQYYPGDLAISVIVIAIIVLNKIDAK